MVVGAKGIDFNDTGKRLSGSWMNERRFQSYDMDEEKDPFVDGIAAMVVHGER